MDEAKDEMQVDAWMTKYRPRSLDSVVGQDYAVNQVRGMIKRKKIEQVMLITGPSGLGKSTLSNIIAYEINQLKYGTPCNDIQEFNMGVDGGIDAVKKIIQSSLYMPSHNFRVFILDEVQKASQAAMSALLKPLEDTKTKKTVWIIVTNEPEKLLGTIRGRATTLNLEAIKPEIFVPRLKYICKKENIDYLDEKILLKIAQNAYGQPRSSIGLLKSVINAYEGSGSKDSKSALEDTLKSSFYNNASLAMKMLMYIYRGNGKAMIAQLQKVKSNEYITLVNYLLEHNLFVFGQRMGDKDWLNEDRKEFLATVKMDDQSPKKILTIHDELVKCKTQLATFMVPERHLLVASLGLLTLRMKKE